VANSNLDVQNSCHDMAHKEEHDALRKRWQDRNQRNQPNPKENKAEKFDPAIFVLGGSVVMQEKGLQIEVESRKSHHGIEGEMLIRDEESRKPIEG